MITAYMIEWNFLNDRVIASLIKEIVEDLDEYKEGGAQIV